MASIRPFRGIRYNQANLRKLDAVVSPPYDVISPEDQQRYYDAHPNNVIRLILPKDNAAGDKYGRAAACLCDWLQSRILAQDEKPSFYAYEQEYRIRGQLKSRLGFACLVRLEDYKRRMVLPHEDVFARPKEDRLNLIRATRANLDSVFGLHAGGRVAEILKPFTAVTPDASAADKDGVRSRLWRVSDAAAIEEITSALSSEAILIADGHHRYEAALAYRNEMRAQADTQGPEAPYEYVMMTLVSLEDEGLVILPTHRLVRSVQGFEAGTLLSRLAEFFEVNESPRDLLMETVESEGSGLHRGTFGLYLGDGRSYVLKLKSTVHPEQAIESHGSDALKRLDVIVLHSLILERLLGIQPQNLSTQSNLSYMQNHLEALRSVDQGEHQMAFLINPTPVEEVKAVAAAGDKMPQKSTFFYPKLLTGLVMRVM